MPNKSLAAILAGVSAALLLTACPNRDNDQLVVYAGRNENLIRPLLERFAGPSGIDISVKYGETSELLPTLLEEGKDTRADVFISQDAGALAVLADEGMLRRLPQGVTDAVDGRFRDPGNRWVGVTGRVRVIAYNSEKVRPEDLPASTLDVTDPKWKGRVGFPPTNASFVAFVSALREQVGESRTRQFLEGLEANDAKQYDNNVLALEAVASGEIDLALVNHYYLYNELKEHPGAKVANFYPGQGPNGEGTFVNVAGVGILATTDRRAEAEQFVRFLLSRASQTYFRDETAEYPLAAGVSAIPELPPLVQLRTIDVPLSRLGRDLEGTTRLLEEVGLT
jgi:iron(III) transport system substrate-binding protein